MSDAAQKWAIVTPSYNLDFDQCQLMCDSVDKFIEGNWHHYIIVNKADYALFAPMIGPRRSVVLNSSVLPQWMKYVGKLGKVRGGSIWFSWRTGFIFGWHLQQIIKLNIASYLSEEMLLSVDSDVFFAKPLKLETLVTEGKITFCRTIPDRVTNDPVSTAFNKQSIQTLRLPDETQHINSAHPLVVWHRRTIINMCDFIGKLHNKHWIPAIYGYRVLSEGTLYGLYIENLEPDRSKFTSREISLSKQMRLSPALNQQELEEFFILNSPDHYAFVVPSPLKYNVKILRNFYNRIAIMG